MVDELFEIDDLAFRMFIKEIHKEANIAKRKLFSVRLNKIEDDLTLDDMIWFALYFFHHLKSFPDEQIRSYFIDFGLDERHLRWFVPVQKIIDVFWKIEEKGIKIHKLSAFFLITLHLFAKFHLEIINSVFGVTEDDGVVMSQPSKKMRQILERRKRAGGDLKYFKHPYEKVMNEFAQKWEQDTEVPLKIMLKHMDGKTEYLEIRALVDTCFLPPKTMSKRRFHIIIYDLLRTIMKDQDSLVDKAGFDWLDNGYGWDEYRARQIKKIVYKK